MAASAVLGSQCVALAGAFRIATLLWVLALALWVVLTYAVFAGFTIRTRKPALDEGISGGRLLAVVATQSVAVLSAYLAPHVGPHRLALNFLALAMWLWGGMLYIWTISLIFYRYAFFRFLPSDFSPSYWINMGAMAISTLAGSLLMLRAPDAPFLASLSPFLAGFTVLCWATATWWIPLLAVLFVWRHARGRVAMKYEPSWWGAVFPLGMYAACTFELARALRLEFLDVIAGYSVYVAVVAWALAFAGLVRSVGGAIIARRNASQGRA